VCYTPDHPVRVRPSCHFFPGWNAAQFRPSGRAWFDDLFLYEQDPDCRNMVVNGGFEGPQVAPGWPRNWNHGWDGDPAPGVTGGPDQRWGLDDSSPYEGRFSLRMVNREKPRPLRPYGYSEAWQNLASGSRLLAGHDYVLSAYLRTDKPGFKVWVLVGWGLGEARNLTSEWQRYVVKVRPRNDIDKPFFRILCSQGDATVWIDAVQIEEGTEATEYREWKE
jgi:hypothetical protein